MKNLGLIAALSAVVGLVGCPKGKTEIEDTKARKIETIVKDIKPIESRIIARLPPAKCEELSIYSAGYNSGTYLYARCNDQQGDIAVYLVGLVFGEELGKITFVPTGAEDIRTVDYENLDKLYNYLKKLENPDKKFREEHSELYKR